MAQFREFIVPMACACETYFRLKPGSTEKASVFELGTDRFIGEISIYGIIDPTDRIELRDFIFSFQQKARALKSL